VLKVLKCIKYNHMSRLRI